MEITFIVLGFVVVFFIGYVVGAVKNTPELPPCCLECLKLHDNRHFQHLNCYGKCCDHFGCESLRRELQTARSEADYFKREAERRTQDFRAYTADIARRPMGEIWFKTEGDKARVREGLEKAMKPLKELEKELNS